MLFEEMIQACLGAAILIRGGRNIIDIDWGLVMIVCAVVDCRSTGFTLGGV